MTDPIKDMMKAGWLETNIDYAIKFKCNPELGTEIICFTRPKQKPNAFVDFKSVETVWENVLKENSKLTMCSICFSAIEMIYNAIKKV